MKKKMSEDFEKNVGFITLSKISKILNIYFYFGFAVYRPIINYKIKIVYIIII